MARRRRHRIAAGGLGAWRFHTAQSDFDRFRDEGGHDLSELEALERTGRRWVIVADVGVGVAIAAGITTGILYLRRPPRRDAIAWLFTGRHRRPVLAITANWLASRGMRYADVAWRSR